MRVAAFRRNGKLLGEFTLLDEASRILNVHKSRIAMVITGKCKMGWALEGPQRKLGNLVFREIDDGKVGLV